MQRFVDYLSENNWKLQNQFKHHDHDSKPYRYEFCYGNEQGWSQLPIYHITIYEDWMVSGFQVKAPGYYVNMECKNSQLAQLHCDALQMYIDSIMALEKNKSKK